MDYVLVRKQDRAMVLDAKVICEKKTLMKQESLRNRFYCNTDCLSVIWC